MTSRFSEGKFSYNGVSTRYITYGQGQPILLFHGIFAIPETYSDIIISLGKEFQVICPQVPPFGHSTVPEKLWTFEEYGNYFAAFIDDLHLKNVITVGHSFGAGVALSTTVQAASDVRATLLITPAILPRSEPTIPLVVRTFALPILLALLGKPTIRIPIALHAIPAVWPNRRRLRYFPHVIMAASKSGYLPGTSGIRGAIVWADHEDLLPRSHRSILETSFPTFPIYSYPGYHNWVFFDPEGVGKMVHKLLGEDKE